MPKESFNPKPYSNESLKQAMQQEKDAAVKLASKTAGGYNRERKQEIKEAQRQGSKHAEFVKTAVKKQGDDREGMYSQFNVRSAEIDQAKENRVASNLMKRGPVSVESVSANQEKFWKGPSSMVTREKEVLSAQEEADRRNYERQNGMLSGALDTILRRKDLLASDVLHERALEENEKFDEQKKERAEKAQQEEINFRRWQIEQKIDKAA